MKSWGLNLLLPDRRPVWDWCAQHIELPPPYSFEGRFDVQRSPHLKAIMDAWTDDHIRTIVLRAPVRSGKTMVQDLCLARTIPNEPGPFLCVCGTDELAADHAEIRIWPLIERNPVLSDLLPTGMESRKIKTQKIRFRNGMIYHIVGPALSNLQAKGYRYVVISDAFLLAQRCPGRIAEAKGRLGDFVRVGNQKLYIESQGSEPDDDFESEWMEGNQQEWTVNCVECGKGIEPVFGGMRDDGSRWGIRWDDYKLPNGDWNIARCLHTIRFECQHCGHVHLDNAATRQHWSLTGRYESKNQDAKPGVSSYHFENVCTGYPWVDLVDEWLKARNRAHAGFRHDTVIFIQKHRALPANETSILMDNRSVSVARYNTVDKWEDEVERVMTIDVQRDHYWVTVRAWGKTGESRRLFFGRVIGDSDIDKIQDEWSVPHDRVLIDSGHDATRVYRLAVAHSSDEYKFGWVCSKGSGQRSFRHKLRDRKSNRIIQFDRIFSPQIFVDPELGQGPNRGKMAILHHYSEQSVNDVLQNLIDKGLWKEPANTDASLESEYARQMTSVFRKRQPDGSIKWITASHGDNHARDCACMQVVIALMLGLVSDGTT